MAAIFLSISYSPSLFYRPFGTIPRAPTIIGITVTFMFHNFFSSLIRSKYLSFCFLFSFLSFVFPLRSTGTAKSTNCQVLIFLLINTQSGLLAGIGWSVCKIPEKFMHLIYLDGFWFVYICQRGQSIYILD